MPEFKNNKKGFTLLEVVIVLAIVAALSTLAVAGYTEYRKASLLSLSADSIVSQIKELKSDTIFGDFEEGIPKCFGFSFVADQENGYRVAKFSQDYLGKKVWDLGKSDFVYQGCDNDLTVINKEEFELDKLVKVISVTYKGQEITPSDLYVRFAPPNGQVSFRSATETVFTEPENEEEAKLIINIKYGLREDEQYQKAIEFDARTL